MVGDKEDLRDECTVECSTFKLVYSTPVGLAEHSLCAIQMQNAHYRFATQREKR